MMSNLLELLICFNLLTSYVSALIVPQQALSIAKPPSLRGVKLGELNFLHTTDTHGWYGSHKTQPDFDADWGDLISFVHHFRGNRIENNRHKGRDLLLVDTGDKHDGNGLSDATVPNGLESNNIFNALDYDLLTLGNHELYSDDRAIFEYYSTAVSKKFKDKYVSSNVNFITDKGNEVPFGNKYLYIKTKNTHRRILALSFIFNFQKVNERAKVTPAIEEVNKDWFKNMTQLYPEHKLDLLLVFGHLPATDPENREINKLHAFLRVIYPNIVIQYFGGHSHIRDFVVLDDHSTCIQSGRFSETVGFLSLDKITQKQPKFFRRYIDFNKKSFRFHARTDNISTDAGELVSLKIDTLRKELELDKQFGFVPSSYYMSKRPITSKENIYNLLTTSILPRLNSTTVISDPNVGRFIMLNTGAVRYDMYKGPFTVDTEYIVLPFPNTWNYFELPLMIAERIEKFLNSSPFIANDLAPPEAISFLFKSQERPLSCPISDNPKRTEGFTTIDDYGCDGDDTKHRSEILYPIPNVIQSNQLVSNDPNSMVQFIFFSFLTDEVLLAANSIGNDLKIPKFKNYTLSDIKDYGGDSAKELLREYIIEISK